MRAFTNSVTEAILTNSPPVSLLKRGTGLFAFLPVIVGLLRADTQPYFKLHGSSNWETEDAEPLLVIGAHKEAIINRHPVLQWYREQFPPLSRDARHAPCRGRLQLQRRAHK